MLDYLFFLSDSAFNNVREKERQSQRLLELGEKLRLRGKACTKEELSYPLELLLEVDGSYLYSDLPEDWRKHAEALSSPEEPILLFNLESDEQLNAFLLALHEAQNRQELRAFPHKAVLTENNRTWPLAYLAQQIESEHRMMQQAVKLQTAIQQASAVLKEKGGQAPGLEALLHEAEAALADAEFLTSEEKVQALVQKLAGAEISFIPNEKLSIQ